MELLSAALNQVSDGSGKQKVKKRKTQQNEHPSECGEREAECALRGCAGVDGQGGGLEGGGSGAQPEGFQLSAN